MKKYLLASVLLITIVLPVMASAQTAPFDANLYFGLTNNTEVTALQEFLTQQAVYSGPISGNFYSLTLAGVKKFQTAEGITPVSGYVGPITRGVMNQILTGQISSSEENATTTKPAVDLSQQNSTATASTNQTWTTPSGAVIGADGTVLSTPTTSTASTPTAPATAPTTASATNNNPALSISLGQSTVTTNSAYLSWNTSIPANSKVFLTQMPVASYSNSTQVISSTAGYSTQGFVNIPNLTANTQYSYTIEATNGTQDQKLTGTISTSALPPPPQIITSMSSDLSALAKAAISSTTCPNTPIIMVRPENGQGIAQSAAGSLSGVTVSVSGNTVTWTDPSATASGYMELDVALADPCVPENQITYTYVSPVFGTAFATPQAWGNNNSSMAFGAIPVTSITPQTITITATEPGGGTATKTITAQMAVVARPSLTISTASNLPSTQITAGAQNFVFANVNLDASQSSEGIRVATLPAYVLTQGTNNADASDLSNCELWNGSTAVATGSNWTDTSNGAYAEFEFQNAFTVPKGTIVQLSLECNLTSNPSGTSYQVGLNGNGPALWIQAEGVASGDNVLPNSGLTVVNSSLPTITVSQ